MPEIIIGNGELFKRAMMIPMLLSRLTGKAKMQRERLNDGDFSNQNQIL